MTEMSGCQSCCPIDPKEALQVVLVPVKEFVDRSHFSADLVRCRACGSHFVRTFEEEVDWVGGDDAQFIRRYSVPLEAVAELLEGIDASTAYRLFNRFGGTWPALCMDHPTDGERTVYWSRTAGPANVGEDLQTIQSNLHYIRKELPTLVLPDHLRARMQTIVGQGLSLTNGIAATTRSEATLKRHQLDEWRDAVHALQEALRPPEGGGNTHTLAWTLLAESATNFYPAIARLRDWLPD